MKPTSQFLPQFLSAALAMVCFSASAQWVWIDQNGSKVYSDRAPSLDIAEKDILKRPNPPQRPSAASETAATATAAATAGMTATAATMPPASATPAAMANNAPTELDKALEAKKKQEKEAEVVRKKEEEQRVWKAKIENCARAKQAYATYNSNVPIARLNAEGGREMVDAQTRAAELQRAQTLMAQNCN